MALLSFTALESGKTVLRRNLPLLLLLGIATCAFIDRSILNTVGQAIKDDLRISDFQLGLLGGAAFALLYSVVCVPFARLSERYSRVVIISISVVVWSVMTLLSGFAASFTFLMFARIGVGVGEAGVDAPSQALLADIYVPEQRASAVAVLGLGTPLGILIGGIGGGFFAQYFGWRSAFEIAAVPGLLLAAITFLCVREPVRGGSEHAALEKGVPSLVQVIARLWASHGFRHMLMAGVITAFIGFGMITFVHPFFVRAYSLDYTTAAIAFALMNSVSNAFGFLAGGLVTDRLIKRDIRFYGWLPAAGAIISCPLYILGFSQVHWIPALVILTVPGLFSATWFAPTFAVTQNLVTPRMRASAIALLSLALNLAGMTLGPAVTGALSDFFASRNFLPGDYAVQCAPSHAAISASCQSASAQGIRYALMLVVCLFLVSGLHFARAGSHLKRELAGVDFAPAPR